MYIYIYICIYKGENNLYMIYLTYLAYIYVCVLNIYILKYM